MSSIVIKGVESNEEFELANDLMARTHYRDYRYGMHWLRSTGSGYPDYRREHTRVMFVAGEMTAALRIFTYTLRIGEARLKMGGLGCVTTAAPHRNKGYAARLMNDAMAYMQGHGYHVSILFGIADFYHRWGFASVIPEYASMVSLREAEQNSEFSGKHRDIKPGDVSALQRIHNRNDGETACSLIRIAAHFNRYWDRWKKARVILDKNGKVVAYFVGTACDGDYCVSEIGVEDYRWRPALLNACVARAKTEYASRLRFQAPPTHPFIQYLMQFRSDHEMHLSRNSDGMMAIVNMEETLECMIPEWESLLMQSAAASVNAEVTLVVDRAPYRIRAHKGAIDTAPVLGANKISLTSVEMAQLLAGYRHVEESLASKRRVINAAGRLLLNTLFVKRTPYVWQQDRF